MGTPTLKTGNLTISATDLHHRDAIRWAVGTPEGKRSETWRLWGDKKGDVYLAMRSSGHVFKVSIHKDRRCYVGYASTKAKESFGAESRYFAQWALPDEEVVRAYSVIIPDSELDSISRMDKNPMGWIPAPGDGKAMMFSVFIGNPNKSLIWESPEKNGFMLGTINTKTRFTWIAYKAINIDIYTHLIEEYRSKIQHEKAAQFAKLNQGSRLVLCGCGETQNNHFSIELNALRNVMRTA